MTMNSGVYNRSLFRKKGTEARDQLRRMGGIMASSPELMQAGMMDQPPVGQPPMAPQTGQGEVRFMAPNLLQPLQPQPMVQPQQPMQRPMAPQQPMQPQPMAPQPMARPAQPMQPQRPMQRFQDGGDVAPFRMMSASFSQPNPNVGKMSAGAGALTFDRAIEVGANAPVAIGQSALPEDLKATLAEIDTALKDPAIPDAQKAKAVTDAMGVESTGDPQTDMQKVVSQLGLNPDREAKIDSLNKAMLGFAIASGTSGSAMENIANGMLAGLKQMRDTEERRAEAELAARTGALEEEATSWFDTPRGKLATGYIEKMMEGTLDVETMVTTLNQLDANSPAGAKLGDEFLRALAAGATPPVPVQTRMETTAPAATPTETPERDMSTLTKQARDKIAELQATDYDPEQKQRDIERVRQMYIEMGGNPDVLGG